MAVERTELQLVWPAKMFAAEARVLLASRSDHRDTAGWLLEEAFQGGLGLKLYDHLDAAAPLYFDDPWVLDEPWAQDAPWISDAPGGTGRPSSRTVRLLEDLAASAGQLPTYTAKRYYAARLVPELRPTVLTAAAARGEWAAAVGALAATGYFEDAFGSLCCDAREDPDGEGQRRLARMLQAEVPMWPLARWEEGRQVPTGVEDGWPDELFFSVVEALHDLAARPRRRRWHDYCDEFDYADFARLPGQAVYRWRVNYVLARSEIGLRLADTGEETGLLVRTAADGREALLNRVAAVVADQDTREHAIALFRGRGASVPEKRSAILVLLGLLESRRDLVKTELLSKDEGALFSIANQFALRHQRADQRAEYDEAYLDWLYWWYLATLDLTDRLLARQAGGAATGAT